MTSYDTAIHDGRQPAISIINTPFLEEPRFHRRKILIETSGRALAYLPLDLLPKNDAISVFERLPKFHQFEHVRAWGAAHLDADPGKVTRECNVRVPDPFRG